MVGAVMRTLASYQCGPGSIPGPVIIMWVEFVVGSCPCSLLLTFWSSCLSLQGSIIYLGRLCMTASHLRKLENNKDNFWDRKVLGCILKKLINTPVTGV